MNLCKTKEHPLLLQVESLPNRSYVIRSGQHRILVDVTGTLNIYHDFNDSKELVAVLSPTQSESSLGMLVLRIKNDVGFVRFYLNALATGYSIKTVVALFRDFVLYDRKSARTFWYRYYPLPFVILEGNTWSLLQGKESSVPALRWRTGDSLPQYKRPRDVFWAGKIGENIGLVIFGPHLDNIEIIKTGVNR